ncbi:hypothetical protein RJ639_045301 [Escallonia herrerae]|uniref:Uncharacterized protein n=1 Tax=Escallonia herrerae TaxID=1293975 RepID=A0AA88W798_9ASTE|nr:hypothetical protein RJ639_045301 [Escallonia herrerae]
MEQERRARNQGNDREMANEGTQRRNNLEVNAEGQGGHNPQRCSTSRATPEMLSTAQVLGESGLILDKFVKLIKNPFFEEPDRMIAKEWLARAVKILDTARILSSQRLVYISFMLEASVERRWKLLSMKWKREGVPSAWKNFKGEFTNKYVPENVEDVMKMMLHDEKLPFKFFPLAHFRPLPSTSKLLLFYRYLFAWGALVELPCIGLSMLIEPLLVQKQALSFLIWVLKEEDQGGTIVHKRRESHMQTSNVVMCMLWDVFEEELIGLEA